MVLNSTINDYIEGDIKNFTDNIYNESANIKDEIISDLKNEFNNSPKSIIESNFLEKKKEFDFINISWKTYRAASIGIIFLSIFVVNFLRLTFDKIIKDPYLIMILNILLLFFIFNLCIFLFYKTYFKYIISKQGNKGIRGKRGKQGLQGKSDNCNISTKKIGTFSRDNYTPKKEIIEDENNIIDFEKINNKSNKSGWFMVKDKYMANKNIGFITN